MTVTITILMDVIKKNKRERQKWLDGFNVWLEKDFESSRIGKKKERSREKKRKFTELFQHKPQFVQHNKIQGTKLCMALLFIELLPIIQQNMVCLRTLLLNFKLNTNIHWCGHDGALLWKVQSKNRSGTYFLKESNTALNNTKDPVLFVSNRSQYFNSLGFRGQQHF